MKIFLCIFTKIVSILCIIAALMLPFSIFLSKKWEWQLLFVGGILFFISYCLININYRILLSTNNPADRNNIFSINKRYNSKMKGSISEYGLHAVTLQDATTDEINIQKRKHRKKKLKKLYEIRN